jgi:hypothetical protein
VIDLGLGLVRRSGEEVVDVLRRQHLAEEGDGGQGQPTTAERTLERREPPEDAHRLDAPACGALAQVKRLETVRPERPVAGLEVGAAAVELVEVENEVDVDVSPVSGEIAQPSGKGGGVERSRGDGHGDLRCVLLRSTSLPGLRGRTRTAAETIPAGPPLRRPCSLSRGPCAHGGAPERPFRAMSTREARFGREAVKRYFSPTATGTYSHQGR